MENVRRARQINFSRLWCLCRSTFFSSLPLCGTKFLYGIVFSLDRVKKLPVDLDLRVSNAFPCDAAEIVTYGSVRFAHLVTLRMQGKRPNRNFDRHRPRLS